MIGYFSDRFLHFSTEVLTMKCIDSFYFYREFAKLPKEISFSKSLIIPNISGN